MRSIASDMLLATLRRQYLERRLTPLEQVDALIGRLAAAGDDGVWICRVPEGSLRERAAALERRAAREGIESLPLYGIPFAVKDNIDVAGLPTTAGCPAFSFVPARSATAVERLLAAGALLVGKTNLDQFATGLAGTRSPYGVPRNPFAADRIPGGSSSGSAVAVAAGTVSFSLGTDTAGSGRVPAACNNIVGLKPTRGLVSAQGVLPACRSLDCVSIFALSVADATAVLGALAGVDEGDPFSRPAPAGFVVAVPRAPARFVFGVPRQADLRFFGDGQGERLFGQAIRRMERLGGRALEIDYRPFAAAGELLYGGAWVAERAAALGDFLKSHAEALHPVTRAIIEGGERFSAVDAFRARYRLEALAAETRPAWRAIDFLLLPTVGGSYRLKEVVVEPAELGDKLGYYTSFVNLLDLAAVAVPSAIDESGLPFGVMLVAPAWHDMLLAAVAERFHWAARLPLGATGASLPEALPEARAGAPHVALAVCGAHLSGEPLNPELVALGARLRWSGRTKPLYRLYALPDGRRPGLVREEGSGHAIELEVWDVPAAALGALLASVAAPLAIGSVELEDGSTVKGFLCEAYAAAGARDISSFGGWRGYRRALAGA